MQLVWLSLAGLVLACNDRGELMGVVEKAYVAFFLELWSSFHPDLCQYVCYKEAEASKGRGGGWTCLVG